MTRTAQLIGDETEMFSIEREVLQTLIRAIGHNDDRLCAARVDPYSMRAIEPSSFLALPSPRANVIELRVVLMNPAQPIPVGDVDIAVRRDGDVGRLVLLLALVGAAFARIAQNPDAFSVERSLRHQVPLRIGQI